MKIGVPKETFPGERRVALTPIVIPNLIKLGLEVLIETGAGNEAGYPDTDFIAKGAKILPARADIFAQSDIVAQVLGFGSNDKTGHLDLPLMRKDQILIGFLRPLGSLERLSEIAATGVCAFSVELIPRTTRAQAMDALSSMGTVAGYKAVILAAATVPRLFPMLTTAAGTITPARVLVLGAGVAGLQAIATARRLGAVVSGYDVRPAAKEQVQSLGAKFVELPLEAKDAQDARGYATAQDDAFYQKQRELLGKVVSESDVVIATAVIPGKKAPILVTADMVKRMAPGSVIVDLAAERGGNCELTKAEEDVIINGVKIIGEINLASTAPYHASQMYSRNLAAFLALLIKKGEMNLDLKDDIIRETLLTRGGQIISARARMFFAFPIGACMIAETTNIDVLISGLFVFALAAIIGFEVIRRVSPLLHTPLMSLTNALDAIAVLGAIALVGENHENHGTMVTILGTIAIIAATSNIVGGMFITDRMLKMFKIDRSKKP